MSAPKSQPRSPPTTLSVPTPASALWKASHRRPSNPALCWGLSIRRTALSAPHKARISQSRMSGLLPQLCVRLVHFIFSSKIDQRFPLVFLSGTRHGLIHLTSWKVTSFRALCPYKGGSRDGAFCSVLLAREAGFEDGAPQETASARTPYLPHLQPVSEAVVSPVLLRLQRRQRSYPEW